MGWAARARVGLWERTQQEYRRRRLAHNLLPRLIWWQFMHLVVALVTLPITIYRYWRNRGLA